MVRRDDRRRRSTNARRRWGRHPPDSEPHAILDTEVPEAARPEASSKFASAAEAQPDGTSLNGNAATTQSSTTSDRSVVSPEFDANGDLHFTRTRQSGADTSTAGTQDADVLFNRVNGEPAAGWRGVETQADYPDRPSIGTLFPISRTTRTRIISH